MMPPHPPPRRPPLPLPSPTFPPPRPRSRPASSSPRAVGPEAVTASVERSGGACTPGSALEAGVGSTRSVATVAGAGVSSTDSFDTVSVIAALGIGRTERRAVGTASRRPIISPLGAPVGPPSSAETTAVRGSSATVANWRSRSRSAVIADGSRSAPQPASVNTTAIPDPTAAAFRVFRMRSSRPLGHGDRHTPGTCRVIPIAMCTAMTAPSSPCTCAKGTFPSRAINRPLTVTAGVLCVRS